MSRINHMRDKILLWMKEHEQELTEFTMNLMRIESQTYDESRAIEFLAQTMREFGFDEVRIDKAGNCIGRVGSGPATIVADAHIDTVAPGKEEDWGFNPLEPQIIDDAICGRGIIDDKGCLSAMIFAGRAIKELGFSQQLSLWISGSIAEEDVEGSCVKALMEEYTDIHPQMILVGEASGGRIIRGHKGRALIRMEVTGKAAHASAAWRGENALIKALPLIKALDEYQDFIEDPFLGKGSLEVTKVICDTPSLNTIPGRVSIIADRRISCGESVDQILSELTPFLELSKAAAFIDIEEVKTYTGYNIVQKDYFPSWVIDEDHTVIRSAKEAYKVITGKEPVVGKWDFCTNATYLCGITGIPSVGFGPGDETLCHGNAERLPISELVEAASIYAMITLCFAQAQNPED